MNISVVIPVYNKSNTIRRALHSIFGQVGDALSDIEVIAVNDGSSDQSLNELTLIQAENPQCNLHIHSQKNAGVSAARNRGVSMASYSLVAFLDADDSYEPHFLNDICRLASRFPQAAVFCTGYHFINVDKGRKKTARIKGVLPTQEDQLLENYFLSAARGDLPITSSSVCIRKSALKQIGGFPEDENMGEDQSVWSQLALDYPIAISARPAANYFEDCQDSLMQTIAPSTEMPFSHRLQKLIHQGLKKPLLRSAIRQYIAAHLIDLARRNIIIGEFTVAKSFLSDPRVRHQNFRRLYWSLKLWIACVKNKLSFRASKLTP